MAVCVFCEITAHRAPARVVYEDGATMAFLPRSPATEGHTLVVPKRHAPDLWSMEEAEAQELVRVALAIGRVLRAELASEGMNLIHSAGRAATQSVFHAHVHLVPRWPGDPMGDFWPERHTAAGPPGDDPAADSTARRLAEALARLRS